jgi:hypothetical protein
VVGTVNTAEFIVAVAASMGFSWAPVSPVSPGSPFSRLVMGGAITAPFAALAHRAPRTLLGVMVGTMVLISNIAIISKLFGVPGAAATALVVIVGAAGVYIAVTAHRREAGQLDGGCPGDPADLTDDLADSPSR